MKAASLSAAGATAAYDLKPALKYCLLEMHLEQVPLVHQLPLPLLQLSSQAPQLTLILAQQGSLVHVLIHTRQVADGLGAVCKLEGAQRLCRGCSGESAVCVTRLEGAQQLLLEAVMFALDAAGLRTGLSNIGRCRWSVLIWQAAWTPGNPLRGIAVLVWHALSMCHC